MQNTVVAVTLLTSVVWFTPPTFAQERIIGLLALPAIWGGSICDPFTPLPVALRSAPRGRSVASVVVVTPMTYYAHGGCEGLEVGVQVPGAAAHQRLPTKEYAYEQPGAIVLERRDNWYRVRLSSGSAWLESSATEGFYSLERLFEDRLTYLTDAWNGRVAASPGTSDRPAKIPSVAPNKPIRVRQAAAGPNGSWFLVDILSSQCEGVDPTVVDQGWVPAYGTGDETTIWIYSRGC
jgi:hypothetical protein